jgi:hypothetical protein
MSSLHLYFPKAGRLSFLQNAQSPGPCPSFGLKGFPQVAIQEVGGWWGETATGHSEGVLRPTIQQSVVLNWLLLRFFILPHYARLGNALKLSLAAGFQAQPGLLRCWLPTPSVILRLVWGCLLVAVQVLYGLDNGYATSICTVYPFKGENDQRVTLVGEGEPCPGDDTNDVR